MKGPIGCSALALILIAASCSPALAGQLWNGRGSDVMMQAAKAQLEQVGVIQTQSTCMRARAKQHSHV